MGVEEEGDEIQELENRLRAAELPEKALKAAAREFKRLKKMSPQMPEYPMLRHYLELVTELPWNKSSKVMVVEASKVPTHGTREGKLKLTGQLGSVMRESAELALSWIRWQNIQQLLQNS